MDEVIDRNVGLHWSANLLLRAVWCAGVACGSVLAALATAALLHRVWKNWPHNLTGLDIRLFWVPAAVLAAWSAMGLGFARKPYRWLAIGLAAALVLALTVAVLDTFNLMMDYEVWVNRGRPETGELIGF